MAKKSKQDLKAFEEYLHHLVQTSPYQPFTTEEIELILQSYGTPKDFSKYRNEKLIPLMKEIHAQQLAQAEAHFRDPSQIRSLGELFESTLTIKNIFVSQLAEELSMTVEEIENYVENRLSTPPLNEAQMKKLAAFTGIAMSEIQRIANETLKPAETKMRAGNEAKTEVAPPKSRRPYPTAANYSSALAIREKSSKK
jgi:hypothetical protein